jgi:hypothetical protein
MNGRNRVGKKEGWHRGLRRWARIRDEFIRAIRGLIFISGLPPFAYPPHFIGLSHVLVPPWPIAGGQETLYARYRR